jgi:putative hydrolase of the HAD superfamily
MPPGSLSSPIEAVILDVGGVLLIPDAGMVNRVLAPLGAALDAEGAEHAHYAGVAALDAAPQDTRAERQAYLRAYAAHAGLTPDQVASALPALTELWDGSNLLLWQQLVRSSVDGLRQLAQTGRKLGIVSNADGTIEAQLRRAEICQIGDGLGVPVLAIVDSHVVGVAKPAAEIFRHALEPLDVQPGRAVYVGDTVRYDVRGARAAGLRPVHFDPDARCGSPADHAHVRRLAEVEALLT